jgi:hypothetical protein
METPITYLAEAFKPMVGGHPDGQRRWVTETPFKYLEEAIKFLVEVYLYSNILPPI